MPDASDLFPHLKDADTNKLLFRRQELAGMADPKTDECLQEMVVIARILRGRTSAPKSASSSAKKVAPTLDAL